MLILLLALPSLLSFQGLPSQIYTPAGTFSASASSITIVYNKDVSTCNCDLTANSCDSDCCCDPDCDPVSGVECTTNLIQTQVTEVERCIGELYLFHYNLRPGMRTYYNSGTKKQCFQSDNSPVRSNFKSQITSFGESMPQLFASQISSFTSAISQSSSSLSSFTASTAYGVRLFYSQHNVPIRVQIGSNYYNFPFPQQDASGVCPQNYSFSPTFLIPSITECGRQVTLDANSCVATSSSYSVQYWRDTIQILSAPNDSSATVLTPTVTYTKITGTSTATVGSATTAWSSPTCTDTLKGFHLTLTYNKDTYVLTAAKYDFIVEDTTATPIEQAFKITFMEQGASSTTYSGNPGYIAGYPLLVGVASNNIVTRKSLGFQLEGPDSSGNCIDTTSFVDTKTLNFAEDTVISCKQTFADSITFGTYCSTNLFRNRLLFTNIQNSFQMVGVFGNAQSQYTGDWLSVVGLDQIASATGTFDSATNSCQLMGGLQIKIIFSKAGEVTNPQNYIVGVEVSPITETWTWFSSTQSFSHWISVKYAEIVPENIDLYRTRSTSSWLPSLPGDIFSFLRTSSTS